MHPSISRVMEIIIESAAWVALGILATLFALKIRSKSRELSIKIGECSGTGREGYATMGVTN
jgi:hypothetical protein